DLQYLYGDKPLDYANIADNPNGRNWFTSIASDGGIHPNVATNGGYPIVDAVRRFLLNS
ncbi:TPA: hypothetical protein QDB14_001756, partial [Burkholderia vietnamiensis]|nr:hypothetical protein [Burkholderia vietnamiensis]